MWFSSWLRHGWKTKVLHQMVATTTVADKCQKKLRLGQSEAGREHGKCRLLDLLLFVRLGAGAGRCLCATRFQILPWRMSPQSQALERAQEPCWARGEGGHGRISTGGRTTVISIPRIYLCPAEPTSTSVRTRSILLLAFPPRRFTGKDQPWNTSTFP